MAQKRMFDKSIIEVDEFMDMPMSTKALYFLLGMEADDEGFVSPNRVMRIYGGGVDDLKVLVAKKFVIQFNSGVVVITDWKENNYLDKNRIKETRYKAEKALLSMETNKYRMLNECLTSIEENSIEENSRYTFSNENDPPKKTFKEFRDTRRIESGRPPMTPRKATDKQKELLSAYKTGIEYFKEKGFEQHGMQFFKVQNEKRNIIVRKLVTSAFQVLGDLRPLIDWWFEKEGEWANYEPEQCFSTKTIERFENKDKIKKGVNILRFTE